MLPNYLHRQTSILFKKSLILPWLISSAAEPQPTDGSVAGGSGQGHGPRLQDQSSTLPIPCRGACVGGTKSMSVSLSHWFYSPPPTHSKKKVEKYPVRINNEVDFTNVKMHKYMPIYTSKVKYSEPQCFHRPHFLATISWMTFHAKGLWLPIKAQSTLLTDTVNNKS